MGFLQLHLSDQVGSVSADLLLRPFCLSVCICLSAPSVRLSVMPPGCGYQFSFLSAKFIGTTDGLLCLYRTHTRRTNTDTPSLSDALGPEQIFANESKDLAVKSFRKDIRHL